MDHIDDGLTWQLLLRATPRRVFCLLVRATTERRNLCEIHDYGMGLTFRAGPRSRLSVRLLAHDDGTLVQIRPVGTLVRRDTVTEAEAIGVLFHDLHTYLDPSRQREPAIRANAPAAVGATSR